MLAQNGNGPTDFENGDKDGWPEKQHGEDMNDDQEEEMKKGPYLPRNGKSDQQRYQLNKTQTNGFRTVRFVQMTTVGQCD